MAQQQRRIGGYVPQATARPRRNDKRQNQCRVSRRFPVQVPSGVAAELGSIVPQTEGAQAIEARRAHNSATGAPSDSLVQTLVHRRRACHRMRGSAL